MKRQRFIATIKSVTEKKKSKSLIRFHSANKINNYNGGGRGGEERRKERNPKDTIEQVKT